MLLTFKYHILPVLFKNLNFGTEGVVTITKKKLCSGELSVCSIMSWRV